jgi:hypothetical protein
MLADKLLQVKMLPVLLLTLMGLQLASGQATIPACSNPFLRYGTHTKVSFYLQAVFQIHDIDVDPDPDPWIHASD